MPAVHGVWEEWSPWSLCSFTCGRGHRTRTRMCAPPQHGGRACDGPETQTKLCNIALCPGITCLLSKHNNNYPWKHDDEKDIRGNIMKPFTKICSSQGQQFPLHTAMAAPNNLFLLSNNLPIIFTINHLVFKMSTRFEICSLQFTIARRMYTNCLLYPVNRTTKSIESSSLS